MTGQMGQTGQAGLTKLHSDSPKTAQTEQLLPR